MYEELVKRLRELQVITEHCYEQSCYECANKELCDKYDNKTLSGTYKEAADAIEELSKQHEAQRQSLIVLMNERPSWIPVTEQCPEKSGDYLVFDDCRNLYVNEWHCLLKKWQYDDSRITHWQPLPEPPKEET